MQPKRSKEKGIIPARQSPFQGPSVVFPVPPSPLQQPRKTEERHKSEETVRVVSGPVPRTRRLRCVMGFVSRHHSAFRIPSAQRKRSRHKAPCARSRVVMTLPSDPFGSCSRGGSSLTLPTGSSLVLAASSTCLRSPLHVVLNPPLMTCSPRLRLRLSLSGLLHFYLLARPPLPPLLP